MGECLLTNESVDEAGDDDEEEGDGEPTMKAGKLTSGELSQLGCAATDPAARKYLRVDAVAAQRRGECGHQLDDQRVHVAHEVEGDHVSDGVGADAGAPWEHESCAESVLQPHEDCMMPG